MDIKRFIVFGLLSLWTASLYAGSQWMPDVLGDGYEMRYVDQPDDYSGKVRSTIVRKLSPCADDKGVLYVHGFNDYFFNAEMGDRFVDSCYNFYAVDLRKYGRSIMEGQEMFQVHNMNEYFPDIDSAIVQMKRDGVKEIVLMGHSTGGLITSLYMNNHPDKSIKVLILNSPFLDWNQSKFQEKFAIPLLDTFGGMFPNKKIPQRGDNLYARSLLKKYGGDWDYNTDWKLEVSPAVDVSWIKAIDEGQFILQNDSHIDVPILLMHSDASYKKDSPADAYRYSDAVLDVDDISRYGRELGIIVTEITVKGGLHDLVLSRKEVKDALYDYMFSWLDRQNL